MRSRASSSAPSASAGLQRCRDPHGCHLQAGSVEIEPVEFARKILQRRVAAGGDVVEDCAYGRFDIGRGLALGGEKGAESLGKVGGTGVEADRHGLTYATRDDAYQPNDIITILILCRRIDKKSVVAQLVKQCRPTITA